ncbi:MAG: winged helix-turn-helix domain-containing protein [Chloroflexi bacterium]|nr:winged helix-turn-helix domain-containing protein [Chloroflexota bacterium]
MVTATIRSVVHQVQRFPAPALRAGPVWVNPHTAGVLVYGRPVAVTPAQLKILALLVKSGGGVVPRQRIAGELWGADPPLCYRHHLAMHIKNLRVKLGDNCIQPRIIVNVRGMGYKIGMGHASAGTGGAPW